MTLRVNWIIPHEHKIMKEENKRAQDNNTDKDRFSKNICGTRQVFPMSGRALNEAQG
jgi:hypothetical protein